MHLEAYFGENGDLTLQRWGNGLAVRISSSVARSAAVKFAGSRGEVSHIPGHQPKSFDWRFG